MSDGADKAADQRVLDATQAYVAEHPDNKLDGFRDAVANWGANWGETWTGITPAHLNVSDLMASSLALTAPGTREHDLMALYVAERASRYWERSYTSADKAVGNDMLSGYGFAEIIGKRGPFVSDRVRAGIGVFAAHVNYPAHHHVAEEIYTVLAGSADFYLGDQAAPDRWCPGDVIHVPSMLTHGFRMTGEPLVVFYLWQGGDLRQKSSFVSAAE